MPKSIISRHCAILVEVENMAVESCADTRGKWLFYFLNGKGGKGSPTYSSHWLLEKLVPTQILLWFLSASCVLKGLVARWNVLWEKSSPPDQPLQFPPFILRWYSFGFDVKHIFYCWAVAILSLTSPSCLNMGEIILHKAWKCLFFHSLLGHLVGQRIRESRSWLVQAAPWGN